MAKTVTGKSTSSLGPSTLGNVAKTISGFFTFEDCSAEP